jgi:hypothetical protein
VVCSVWMMASSMLDSANRICDQCKWLTGWLSSTIYTLSISLSNITIWLINFYSGHLSCSIPVPSKKILDYYYSKAELNLLYMLLDEPYINTQRNYKLLIHPECRTQQCYFACI